MLRLNKAVILVAIFSITCIPGAIEAPCSYKNNDDNEDRVEVGRHLIESSVGFTEDDDASAAPQCGQVGRFAAFCLNRVGSLFSALIWTSSPKPVLLEPVGDSRFGELPLDLLKILFDTACRMGCDPRDLERVNKKWHTAFRYNISAGKGVVYSTKKSDFFMEQCMVSFVDAQVSRMELVYFYRKSGLKQLVPFFDDGGSDLSVLESSDAVANSLIEQWYDFTMNRDTFVKAGGVHLRTTVTLVIPVYKALDMLPPEALRNCCETDVVIFWRYNDGVTPFPSPVELLDHTTTQGVQFYYHICNLGELYRSNVYSLWKKSKEFVSPDFYSTDPFRRGNQIKAEKMSLGGLKRFYFQPEG